MLHLEHGQSAQTVTEGFHAIVWKKKTCTILCVPFLHEGHANLVDAPTLMGVMMPLLLYTDDLILMCDSAAGLQKHLDTRELLRTTSTYRLVKNINLQSTSAQQRWYCLSINAVMCQTLC